MSLVNRSTQVNLVPWVLALLMILSRPHALSGIVHLADASNAVFFIGGLMLLSSTVFILLTGLSVAIDFISIGLLGTDAFCISPSYGFLLPAYALLWFGGRWLSRHCQGMTRPLVLLGGFVLLQTIAFMITSGSFWFLSGRFADPDWAGMVARTQRYLPGYLMSALWYVLIFLVMEQGFRRLSSQRAVD